ncbi:uncharacterized protein AB675_7848 [Cyphellophora attinorum]|uniref:Uncharacterized protein n=1 Tax=Cyphellophora attinorum TaxID=1664694 RepID=A0A0N1HC74_9EURO|nr:uncharacterized protein AB675_7848 [Phialophora attinorum]KPI41290.1 hypothetical protein AB675_7848 [Phialophora attinorum]
MTSATESRKRWSDLFSFRAPRVESIQGLIGFRNGHDRDSQLTVVEDSRTEDLSSSSSASQGVQEQQNVEDTPEEDRITALPTVYMMDVYRPKSSSTANSKVSTGNRLSSVFGSIGRTLRRHRQKESPKAGSGTGHYDGVVLVPPSRQAVQRPGTPFPRSNYADQRATLKKPKPASAAQSSTTVESKGSSGSRSRVGGFCCGMFGSSSKGGSGIEARVQVSESGNNGRIVEETTEEEEMSFEDMLGTAPPNEAATLPTVPYRDIGRVQNDCRAGFGAGNEEAR